MSIPSLNEIRGEVNDTVHHPPPEGLINHVKEEHRENEPEGFSVKFQIQATALIIGSALTGTLLGAILSSSEVSEDVVSWIGLPGDLFIRALKCIVLPLVFVNVVLAVMQMAEAGKAGKVGIVTVGVYLVTTLVAALEGLFVVLIFKSNFSKEDVQATPTFINILCPTEGLSLVQEGDSLLCVNNSAFDETTAAAQFELDNENRFFLTTADDIEPPSFSQTLQDNIFRQLVPENIVQEFANGSFVGVVMFGILFGAASQGLSRKPVLLLKFFNDLNDILVRLIEFIILLTPFAVISLIAGALAAQKDLAETFSDLAYLIATVIVGDVLHLFLVYPLIFFAFTRSNYFAYLKFLLPAQFFAFASASSAATLPVTMKCVQSSKMVPDSIRDFVLPIGATINMDGAALYFPAALIFLSAAVGIESGPAEYFLILIVSTIGSAGAAPVPNAGLVLLLTAYGTVYSGGVPESFGLLFGVDWLIDRLQTAINITGDAMVARIVSHISKVEVVPGRPTSFIEVAADEQTKEEKTL